MTILSRMTQVIRWTTIATYLTELATAQTKLMLSRTITLLVLTLLQILVLGAAWLDLGITLALSLDRLR
jgi:hypothetical protein